jgi:hypothetical protein
MRSIPLNDPDFERLHGLREDTESMHNEYKWRAATRFAGFRSRGRGGWGELSGADNAVRKGSLFTGSD